MNRNTTMVHYPTPTTYCEVSYDSDWYDDRRLTPYRYSLMRNDDDSNSDTVSLTLPSQTYYEYLKSFYDCRTTTSVQRKTNGYPGHLSEHPSRAPTWHAFSRDSHMDYARQNLRSEPSRIRPTYAFPALHIMQGGDSGDDNDGEMALLDRSREKLVWVDVLNKWVPQHQLQPRPYMSFIGNPPTVEKLLSRSPKENEKREAVKKRAQEIAEQKKQRKAYSTPLYTPVSDRQYKKRISLAKSMPVSPVQEVERVPSSPRQVWEDESRRTSGQSKTESHPSGSFRREISITLVPKEESDKETAEERQAKLAAEQRLIESLEKQRQQQAAEQQRLLREQQEKENQRKEQERRAEEERLRQLNERKQPLAPSNHDNTSTAGLVLSQNPPLPASSDTFKANTQTSTNKPEETASKYADKSKPNNLSKISKKATTDKKPKFDKETKQKGHDAAKKTANENYKDADKGGKADVDVSAEREKGGGRDETDNQMADGEFNVGVAPTPAQGE